MVRKHDTYAPYLRIYLNFKLQSYTSSLPTFLWLAGTTHLQLAAVSYKIYNPIIVQVDDSEEESTREVQ